MLIYAAASDLTGATPPWITGSAPANVDNLLRSASLRIARAANRDVYTDQPTTDEAAVLKDATCAQVQAWITLGIDPAAAGLDSAPVKKATVLSGDVEQDTTGQVAALQLAATDLAPLARDILEQAGLLWLPTALGDPAPFLYDYGLSGPIDPCGLGSFWWGADLTDWPVCP